MRKLVLLLTFSITILTVESQTVKGTWLVGGSGSFYPYRSEYRSVGYATDGKYTQIDVASAVGYFLADRIALGIKPRFTSIKGGSTSVGSVTTNVQRYWIGPFGRFYFLDISSRNNVVADVSYQRGFLGSGFTGSLTSISALAGPVVFLNSSIGVECLLGYSSNKEDVRSQELEWKGIYVSIGFQIHIK